MEAVVDVVKSACLPACSSAILTIDPTYFFLIRICKFTKICRCFLISFEYRTKIDTLHKRLRAFTISRIDWSS